MVWVGYLRRVCVLVSYRFAWLLLVSFVVGSFALLQCNSVVIMLLRLLVVPVKRWCLIVCDCELVYSWLSLWCFKVWFVVGFVCFFVGFCCSVLFVLIWFIAVLWHSGWFLELVGVLGLGVAFVFLLRLCLVGEFDLLVLKIDVWVVSFGSNCRFDYC